MTMDLRLRHLFVAAATLSFVALTGCTLGNTAATATPTATLLGTIQGKAFGGNQPIVGMQIYVYAAGTGGYGGASQSLLTSFSGVTYEDGSDNYYVLTDSTGGFSVTGDYTCMPGQQIYLYGVGGNTGANGETVPNTAAGLLAVLGTCPSTRTMAAVTPYVWLNEVTTVAAAYSFAGFATDATDVSDDETLAGNPTQTLAKQAMAQAFANAANLSNLASGTALTIPPGASAGVAAPQSQLDTIANIIASCINTSSSSSGNCSTLFQDATADGTLTGTQPTDTATAAINIAHHPATTNTAALWGLINGQPAFLPYSSTAAPADLTLSIEYPNGSQGMVGLAADGNGNVFATYGGGNAMYKFTPSGVITEYVGTAATNPAGIAFAPRRLAVDASNNVWVPTTNSTTTEYATVRKFDDNLDILSQYDPYDGTTEANGLNSISFASNGDLWVSGGGSSKLAMRLNSSGVYQSEITEASATAFQMAINPSGVLAISGGTGSNTVSLYNSAGTLITTTAASLGGLNKPEGMLTDMSGNFWATNEGGSTISEISATGTAVSTNGYTTSGSANISGDFDGSGNYFCGGSTSTSTPGVYELNSTGTQVAVITPVSIVTGGGAAYNEYFAADPSGNLWVSGNKVVYEMIGLSAPKITPIVTATFSGKTGTWRP
jgi:hypothetical protein